MTVSSMSDDWTLPQHCGLLSPRSKVQLVNGAFIWRTLGSCARQKHAAKMQQHKTSPASSSDPAPSTTTTITFEELFNIWQVYSSQTKSQKPPEDVQSLLKTDEEREILQVLMKASLEVDRDEVEEAANSPATAEARQEFCHIAMASMRQLLSPPPYSLKPECEESLDSNGSISDNWDVRYEGRRNGDDCSTDTRPKKSKWAWAAKILVGLCCMAID